MVSGVSDVNCKFSELNASPIPNETLITGGHSKARAKLGVTAMWILGELSQGTKPTLSVCLFA